MSWSKNQSKTIARLQNLNVNKIAAFNLQDRLEYLEAKADGLKATRYDKDRVSGGETTGDTRIITNITERMKTRNKLEKMKQDIRELETNLLRLSRNEQRILECIDINNELKAVDHLIDEIGYSQATIYRIRKSAIETLTKYLYPGK